VRPKADYREGVNARVLIADDDMVVRDVRCACSAASASTSRCWT
jgi:hypothetical protein